MEQTLVILSAVAHFSELFLLLLLLPHCPCRIRRWGNSFESNKLASLFVLGFCSPVGLGGLHNTHNLGECHFANGGNFLLHSSLLQKTRISSLLELLLRFNVCITLSVRQKSDAAVTVPIVRRTLTRLFLPVLFCFVWCQPSDILPDPSST